jgi:hypothetical protein
MADAVHQLRTGQLDPAAVRLHALLRVVRLMEDQRLIISQLVRVATAGTAFEVTWEALQAEGWTDNQLARLQADWQTNEFLLACARAVEMERAFGFELFRRCREDPLELQGLMSFGAPAAPPPPQQPGEWSDYLERRASGSAMSAFGSVWATFWSYNDEHLFLETIQATLDRLRPCATTGGVALHFPGRQERARTGLRSFLTGMMLPDVGGMTIKFGRAQTQREMAVAALALRRYQLRHQRLPANLRELVPEFLDRVPLDWMDGQPLRYRLKPAGGFVLYSVGDNGTDDGGDASLLRPASVASFLGGKDFVWPEPAAPDEPGAKPRE